MLRRRRFLTGAEAHEIEWFTPSGTTMTAQDWADPNARCIAIYLDGRDAPDRDGQGRLLVDDDLLVLVNGWSDPIDFVLPDPRPGASWSVELDSADLTTPSSSAPLGSAGTTVNVGPRSVLVLSSPTSGVPQEA